MNKKIKIIINLTMVAMMGFLTFSLAQSQETRIAVKKRGGMGYFMFGGSIIDINSLNSRLENKGYSKLSNNFISFGGGGHGIINKVIIGGEGHGLIGKETTSGNYKTSLNCGYGFFNLGYIIYSTRNFNIYPLLGLGGGGMSLKIVERGTPSFDEVLDNPKRSTELSTGGLLIHLSVGTDYLLKKVCGCGEGEGGLVFGLRVGYILAPFKGDWEMDGLDISEGPEIGITGPYIRLMIGFGGFGKR